MAYNTQGAISVPLTVFGSWVTDMAPGALPEGCSPDNQDLIFHAGSVKSRPGLEAVYSTQATLEITTIQVLTTGVRTPGQLLVTFTTVPENGVSYSFSGVTSFTSLNGFTARAYNVVGHTAYFNWLVDPADYPPTADTGSAAIGGAFPAGGDHDYVPTLVYGKSFVLPNGDIQNLTYDSNGVMWMEDFTNDPGEYSFLFQSTPGSYCKSITAFGREWIAISDGLHAADIAYSWDGTRLSRVTQDGPGTAPTVTSLALPPATMAPSATPTSVTINTATPESPASVGGSTFYIQIWFNVTSTAGFFLGEYVTVTGNSAWDGTYSILNISGNNIICSAYIPSADYVVGNGGDLFVGQASTLIRTNNQVLCTTETPHNLQRGYYAQISNVPATGAGGLTAIETSDTVAVSASYWETVDGGAQYRLVGSPGASPSPLADFVVTGFGITLPATAVVTGVSCTFGISSQSATTGTVHQVALWYSGAQLGSNKTPATPITTSITPQTYGSGADLWGNASIPLAVATDSSFGFAVSIAFDSIRDFITTPFQVVVSYFLPGGSSGAVANIQSIVIDNETAPGQALVTTSAPHGLLPGNDVTMLGINPVQVATIASIVNSSSIVTLTSPVAHNLVPGALINVADTTLDTPGYTGAYTFNGTFTVATVPAPNQVTYAQALGTADPDVITGTADTGEITLSWPVPDDTPTPTYFTVLSAPTPTTFYVQLTYSDATWGAGGTVGFGWEGIFLVLQVINATQFYYQQYGPNASTTAVGTVTPSGQAAPGLHLCQCLFLLEDGTITEPGAPTTFIANGGQYVSVTNIPQGPSNVVGRILAFTGAQPNVPGLLPPFFYLAVAPQLEGQLVGTATQIDDNTTTSVLLDFSDNALFGSSSEGGAISVSGNNLAAQIVLDGALGFAYFESRLTTWGQRNVIQNLAGMRFGGGTNSSAPTVPGGWSVPSNSVNGSLSVGVWSGIWTIAAETTDTLGTSGLIQQGAYQDWYGAPIVDGNTNYTIRFKVTSVTGNPADLQLVFFLSSVSSGFLSTATFNGSALSTWQLTNGGWFEANFNTTTPTAIPTDLLLGLYAVATTANVTVGVTELSLIDTQEPYLDQDAYTSYTNNPTGFDGVSGNGQPTEDTHKIMDMSILRGTPYAHTQDPAGRLHEIIVNPTSEPSGWTWKEVQSNCGVLSAFCVTHSQADDQTGSSGDDWLAWASETGALIFEGSQARKVSQEISPNWYDPQGGVDGATIQINMAAATTISALVDPVERMLYYFLPTGTNTAPNLIYPMSFRNLNNAYAIDNSPPFHPSFSGKLIATDNTRKWTRWNLAINGAARMYRISSGQLTTVFFGGNGQALNEAEGFGNAYTLNPNVLTDADYGQISPYYVTCFFLDPDKSQQIGLATTRLLLAYLTAFITGVGQVTYSYLCDSLDNPWALTTTRKLSLNPKFDQECAGGNAQANRIAIKIASTPVTGTDNGFNLERIQFLWKRAKLIIRGAAK